MYIYTSIPIHTYIHSLYIEYHYNYSSAMPCEYYLRYAPNIQCMQAWKCTCCVDDLYPTHDAMIYTKHATHIVCALLYFPVSCVPVDAAVVVRVNGQVVVQRVGAHVLIRVVLIFEFRHLHFFRQLGAHVRQKGLGELVSFKVNVEQSSIWFESHASMAPNFTKLNTGCKVQEFNDDPIPIPSGPRAQYVRTFH